MDTKPFAPHFGTNKILACSATPGTTTIANHNETVRVLNTGTFVAYVRVGDGPQDVAVGSRPAVSTADMPIAAGQSSTFRKPIGNNGSTPQQFGFISPDGATTLHMMTGNGGV